MKEFEVQRKAEMERVKAAATEEEKKRIMVWRWFYFICASKDFKTNKQLESWIYCIFPWCQNK